MIYQFRINMKDNQYSLEYPNLCLEDNINIFFKEFLVKVIEILCRSDNNISEDRGNTFFLINRVVLIFIGLKKINLY